MTNPTNTARRAATIALVAAAVKRAERAAAETAEGHEIAREYALTVPVMLEGVDALCDADEDVVTRARAAFARHGFRVMGGNGHYGLCVA
jgi:hypothetical protein